MKVVIAGSRSIKDYAIVREAIEESPFEPDVIVHGDARGVDELADRYAAINGIDVDRHPPPSDMHPKAAPKDRNEDMAELGDALIAVWDGVSTGTEHMMEQAKNEGMELVNERVILNLEGDARITAYYYRK